MFPWKALLVSLPIALVGGFWAHRADVRVGAAREAIRGLDAAGRQESEAFFSTMETSHAKRQLDLLSSRRAAALELATARRDRVLGLVLVGFAAVAYAFVRTAQRIGRELDQDREFVSSQPRARRDVTRG